MADVHDPEVRSYNMSKISGKNTKPEILVRKYLFGEGFRYRLHVKELPGKPDIVLSKFKTIIQVHGCFWHAHEGCKYFKIPETRQQWWIEKFKKTQKNDQVNLEMLKEMGWKVIIIWECKLKTDRETSLLELKELILNNK